MQDRMQGSDNAGSFFHLEPFDKIKIIFKMTKLMQWLCFLLVTFTIWFSLLADVLPLKLSEKAKEVVFPFPVYMVIVFGCYSLGVIGYRVLTFNDCEDAAESLKKEIQEARRDLTSKGYKFE